MRIRTIFCFQNLRESYRNASGARFDAETYEGAIAFVWINFINRPCRAFYCAVSSRLDAGKTAPPRSSHLLLLRRFSRRFVRAVDVVALG